MKLRATCDRYQGFCESGVDGDFGKGAANLVSYVEGGGFYTAAGQVAGETAVAEIGVAK